MRLLARDKRMLIIAFGGGLYWASSLLLFMPWKASAGAMGSSGSLIMPIAVCLISMFYLFRKVFFKRKFQVFLAASIIAVSIINLALSAFDLTSHPLGYVLCLFIPGCYHGCSIVFWGLNFASLSKEESEKTVFLTLLFAFILYLAGSSISIGFYGYLIAELMKMLAATPFLLGLYELVIVEREPKPENQKLLLPFIFSRCFFGGGIGIISALSISVGPMLSPGISLIACVILLAIAIYFLGKESKFSSFLRVMPLLAAGLLILPYIGTEGISEALYQESSAIVWLSWIILSSVQLSDLKQRLGWDEARLVLFEKLIVVVPWLVGQFVITLLRGELPEAGFETILTYTPTLFSYLAVIVSCYLLADLIARKERQRIIERVFKQSKDELDSIYLKISSDYKLTNREKEVFVLLAQGYTRPRICEKLVISEGTARSHTDHIYKKLDIHSREELLKIVDKRKIT